MAETITITEDQTLILEGGTLYKLEGANLLQNQTDTELFVSEIEAEADKHRGFLVLYSQVVYMDNNLGYIKPKEDTQVYVQTAETASN